MALDIYGAGCFGADLPRWNRNKDENVTRGGE